MLQTFLKLYRTDYGYPYERLNSVEYNFFGIFYQLKARDIHLIQILK